MKMSKLALTAMIASACCAGTAFGQTNRTAPKYYPASYYSYYQDGAAAAAPVGAPITDPLVITQTISNLPAGVYHFVSSTSFIQYYDAQTAHS